MLKANLLYRAWTSFLFHSNKEFGRGSVCIIWIELAWRPGYINAYTYILKFCDFFWISINYSLLTNVVSFLDIESKLRQIEEDPEGSGTTNLYESTHRISELANRAFQPLFERQVDGWISLAGDCNKFASEIKINELDVVIWLEIIQVQAEKIRSVQGMLQRFRTLFNLPSIIRGNISKGEYDLAVREYRKAKSIVLPSHVRMLLVYSWWFSMS